MATITGFVEPKRDYAVFVVVMGMQGGRIPLVIEKGNFPKKMWKLPGGRPTPEDNMDKNITAMREVDDEIGIVVEYPEKEFFRKNKSKHDFIVLEAKYFSGDFIAKAEIERAGFFFFYSKLSGPMSIFQDGGREDNIRDNFSCFNGQEDGSILSKTCFMCKFFTFGIKAE